MLVNHFPNTITNSTIGTVRCPLIPDDSTNHQIPSSLVSPVFGEVNVLRTGTKLHVSFTILREPEGAEALGYQTGVAIDVSASMKSVFGQTMQGHIPPEAMEDYRKKGLLKKKVVDGREIVGLDKIGQTDAVNRGFLKRSPNIIEPMAREFVHYLADRLDEDGGTTVIYWAGGTHGEEIEVLGDVTAAECASLVVAGPKRTRFGNGTRLLPAVRYFVDRFQDAQRGMYLFLTDGAIDDLEIVKQFSVALAHQIHAQQRFPVKFVLIGLGDHIDESQMEELDDLDSGVPVDLWDHKIAGEMRQLCEIFAEVVDENQIVASCGTIHDASGKVVKNFLRGVPARVKFELSASNQSFEFRCEGEVVRQVLTLGR